MLQRAETGRECSPATHRLRLWGLGLGAASPRADRHGAGTLRLSVCGVLTRMCAYSVRHPHLGSLHANGPPGASPLPRERLAMGSRLPPTALDGHVHKAARASFRCPWWLQHCETGRECSPATHRLRLWGLGLGAASPRADRHGAGTLRLTVCGVLTRMCAYSVRHPHFPSLHPKVPTGASLLRERSPTPLQDCRRPSFGGPLNPDHSRRVATGPVSYYALFQGMAASKPTSRLSR